MSEVFKYFLLLPLSKSNKDFFLFFFYLSITTIFLLFFFISYTLYKFSIKQFRLKFYSKCLKFILPLVSNTLFLPIFFTLIKIIECENNVSSYSNELKCYTGDKNG